MVLQLAPNMQQPAVLQWPYRQYDDGDGVPHITLLHPGGYTAEIMLYGAQVVSWTNEREEELLFISTEAVYEPPHPARGGIPICFPKFYDNVNMEENGFARTRMWRLEDLMHDIAFPVPPRDHAFVDFILDNMPDNFPNWPNHRFELRLRVMLGPTGDLTMISRVKNVNIDGNPFTFKFAYHTYFPVSDIRATQVEGLETVDFVDYLQMHERFTEGPNPITFDNEIDRVYLNTPDEITVRDRELRRTFTIHKDANLPEIVVWNPWDLEARRTADLGDEEYKEMVCVEAAAVESDVTLNPDQEWTGTQRLSVEYF
ncbi:PREDICTED: putative glucose-6-phosphate 1-epimerase [Erythranthe guttata]|nr:PREDICTED: putative glucose-6-phosphate 1-epimerase [Erythranthe guttata]|eukprot:XP_012835413.1 PREDICTED: putative glucose-6-phosphate 1-epimerase [Erythranthe guttata]